MEKTGNYKNGQLSDTWTYWNETGIKYLVETYLNGEKNGPFVEWYPNGQKHTEQFWKKDKKDG